MLRPRSYLPPSQYHPLKREDDLVLQEADHRDGNVSVDRRDSAALRRPLQPVMGPLGRVAAISGPHPLQYPAAGAGPPAPECGLPQQTQTQQPPLWKSEATPGPAPDKGSGPAPDARARDHEHRAPQSQLQQADFNQFQPLPAAVQHVNPSPAMPTTVISCNPKVHSTTLT